MRNRDFAYIGVIGIMGFLLYKQRKKIRSCNNLIASLPEGYTFNDPKGFKINPRIRL
jgi:hypothetical protein